MTLEEAIAYLRPHTVTDNFGRTFSRSEALRLILDEVERLKDTLDGVSSEASIWRRTAERCENEKVAAEAHAKRLEDALRFYEREWVMDADDPGVGGRVPGETYSAWVEPSDALMADKGKVARAALSLPKEEKTK